MGFLKIHQLPKGTQINDKDEFLYSDINGDTKTVTADKVHSFIKSKQQSGAKKLEAALKDHDKRIKENKDEIAKPHHTTMIVTAMTEGIGFKSDYNATQIKKYADAGGTIILRFNAPDGSGEQSYNYETYKDGFAIFRRAAIIGGKSKRIVIKINDLFNVYKTEEDANYYTKEETVTLVSDRAGNKVTLNVDENFIMTLKLLNAKGNELSRAAIDLPLETMVVNAKFDSKTKELVIVLENGNELRVPIGDLVKGLVSQNTFDAAVKDLQQQIIANNDELNNLVIEVSDVQQDIGLIQKDQKLQNKAIQKNVDDIHENKRNIGSNTKRVKTLEASIFDSGAASGEFINVKDSNTAEFIEIKSSIAKAQETTKGYQLFSYSRFTPYICKVTDIDNKFVFANETMSDAGNLVIDLNKYKLKNGTNYTIKIIFEGNITGGNYKNIYLTTNAQSGISLGSMLNNSNLKYTYKPTTDDDFIKLISFDLSSGLQFNDYSIQIVIYEGTYDKTYEPYTGGQASPNPEYPSEIAKVVDDWETTSTGSNILNEEEFIRQINLTSTATKEKYKGKDCIKIVYRNTRNEFTLKTKPNTQYTIKFNLATKNNNYYVYALYEDGTKILVNAERLEDYKTFKVVTEKNKTLKGITINIFKYDVELYFNELDIREGTTDTPYEPYQAITNSNTLNGNEFLPGDEYVYQFNEDEGTYYKYLKKNMGEFILKGLPDEKWNMSSLVLKDYNGFYLSDVWNKTNNDTPVICNYFTQRPYNDWQGLVEASFIETVSKGFGVRVKKSLASTTEEFRAWLSTHTLKIIYKLDTPQLIPIEKVDIMNMSYNPITNIFSSIDNIKLDVKYYRDFVNTISNLQLSNKTLKQEVEDNNKAIEDLTTRVTALESKPASTESEVINNA